MADKERYFSEKEIMLELYDRCVHGSPAGVQFANSIVEFLKEIPAADVVEVVHGRWIKDGEVVVCSECGEEHAWDEYRATYCENCGAKMDGERKDGE